MNELKSISGQNMKKSHKWMLLSSIKWLENKCLENKIYIRTPLPELKKIKCSAMNLT